MSILSILLWMENNWKAFPLGGSQITRPEVIDYAGMVLISRCPTQRPLSTRLGYFPDTIFSIAIIGKDGHPVPP